MESIKDLSDDIFVSKRNFWKDMLFTEHERLIEKSNLGREINPKYLMYYLSLGDVVRQIDWGGIFPDEFVSREKND